MKQAMKKRTVAKSILIEWRKPESPLEKKSYGATYANNHVAKIFIDAHSSQRERVDTFFHELVHVFFAFHNHNVPSAIQEKLAAKIGKLTSEVLSS